MVGVGGGGPRRHGAWVALAVSVLGFANQLVSLLLGHLAAAHHVLNEVSRAFDGEPGEAGRRIDDVFHCRRHLAAGFETDLVSAGGHFGDSVANVLPTVPWTAAWGSGRRGRFGAGGLCLDYRRFFRHRGVPGIRLGRGHRDD